MNRVLRISIKTYRCNASGFSLVEMAIVLVIVSLMLSGLMMSLSQTNENTRRSDAKAQLTEVEEALYGFAQTYGRLPCPAIPNPTAPVLPGAESPMGGGICTRQHGFIPSATLGLKGSVNADGLLLDPWGNPLRYSVTTANTSAFTAAGQMRTVGIAALTPDLRVCREAACTNVIVNRIPAVVLSMGKNWAIFTSADELANAGETTVGGGPSGTTYRIANNLDFVSANYSEENFDDTLTWISSNILYTKMISAGQLP
jgi:prepilin-type N-terminal cleavage/methylation domain-containing protein